VPRTLPEQTSNDLVYSIVIRAIRFRQRRRQIPGRASNNFSDNIILILLNSSHLVDVSKEQAEEQAAEAQAILARVRRVELELPEGMNIATFVSFGGVVPGDSRRPGGPSHA
jgi:hypothetical protein